MSVSKRLTLAALVVGCLFLVSILAFSIATPTSGQSNIPCYRAQGGAQYVAGSGCAYQFQSGATLEAQVGSRILAGGYFLAPAQTPIAVTPGAPIAANGLFQPFSSGAVTGLTLTVGSAGQVYVYMNTGTNAVTITDTSTTVLASNFAMGQYDVLGVRSDGTRMIELFRSNN